MATEEARVEQLQAELQAELTPAQYERVVQLTLAVEAAAGTEYTHQMDALVEAIAQHFGCLAPVIRAVALHVTDRVERPDIADTPDGCGESWAAVLLANPG